MNSNNTLQPTLHTCLKHGSYYSYAQHESCPLCQATARLRLIKEATDKATGLDVKYEFMRRNGLVYHRSTLVGLWLSYSDRFLNQLKTAKNSFFILFLFKFF